MIKNLNVISWNDNNIAFNLELDDIIINYIEVYRINHELVERRGSHGIPFEFNYDLCDEYFDLNTELEIYKILNEKYMEKNNIPLYLESECDCKSCLKEKSDKERIIIKKMRTLRNIFNDNVVNNESPYVDFMKLQDELNEFRKNSKINMAKGYLKEDIIDMLNDLEIIALNGYETGIYVHERIKKYISRIENNEDLIQFGK